MGAVLVVDDNKYLRDALALALKSVLCADLVRTVQSGEEARDFFDSSSVSAIVTDLRMAGLDGFELIRHVRSKDSQVPIIVMSALDQHEVELSLESFGVHRCFEKPFSIFELAETVARVIKLQNDGVTVPVVPDSLCMRSA